MPLFANWGSFRHSSLRVNDPIHGEKYMYPHEITVIFAKNITVFKHNCLLDELIQYQNRLSGMSHIKYKEGDEHPANPKIRNYCKFN